MFEYSVPNSKVAYETLLTVISTLRTLIAFSSETYAILAQRCVAHASRLLRRVDQVKGLAASALLFWEHPGMDPHEGGKKAAEILQIAQERAGLMLDPALKAEALVGVLERYLWFFGKGCEAVLPHHVMNLIAQINGILSELGSAPTSELTAVPGPLTGSVFGDNLLGAGAPGGVVGSGKVRDEVVKSYGNTIAHLRGRIEEGRRTGGRWREIELADQDE